MKTLAPWTRAAGAGVMLVAVGLLGACGDSDGDSAKDSSAEDNGGGGFGGFGRPPDDASREDFCKVALDQPGDDVDAIHDWADKAEEVGTPEDIPDEARDGFELLVDTAKDIDEDDLEDESLEEEFSDEDQDAFEAYVTYVAETCAPDPEDLEIPEPDES